MENKAETSAITQEISSSDLPKWNIEQRKKVYKLSWGSILSAWLISVATTLGKDCNSI